VVQDLPVVESAFNANIGSSKHASRIQFQKHDFFNAQDFPADVFLVKSVFHDWSDKYVLQIVRNLVGVFKPGNHLLIFDFIVPEEYDEESKSMVPLPARKIVSALDLQMFVACNSKERKLKDWKDVVKQADGRFEFQAVHILPGVPFGLVDFVFRE
jgi:hypothetical protein